MCLLCLYRFSELLKAVLGDILFNGRCDVLSRTDFDRGSEWGLVFSVIFPQFLVLAVKLADILMFTVFGEDTV